MIHNVISSVLLSAAFLSLPLCAQFDNLVTTDDGSTLLFQSQWRLAGSGDGNLSKIYSWDSHGFPSIPCQYRTPDGRPRLDGVIGWSRICWPQSAKIATWM
jgi:hypothetical protein